MFILVLEVCSEPPEQYSYVRRGWEGCSGPSDPAGGASPPGDLGAVLPRFPEPNPAGATPAGAPGSPRRAHPVHGKKSRHEAGHAPRMLLRAAEAFRQAEQTWRPVSAPAGPSDAPAGMPAGRAAEAGGCAKSQRLLLSGCGSGSAPSFQGCPQR